MVFIFTQSVIFKLCANQIDNAYIYWMQGTQIYVCMYAVIKVFNLMQIDVGKTIHTKTTIIW